MFKIFLLDSFLFLGFVQRNFFRIFIFWAFVSFDILRPQIVSQKQDEKYDNVYNCHGDNHRPSLTPVVVRNSTILGAQFFVIIIKTKFSLTIIILKEVGAVKFIIIKLINSLSAQFWASPQSFTTVFVREDAEVQVAKPIKILIVNWITVF